MTSHFAYVKLWITGSIFAIPLDFDIARLACIFKLHIAGSIGYINSSYGHQTNRSDLIDTFVPNLVRVFAGCKIIMHRLTKISSCSMMALLLCKGSCLLNI